MDADDVDTDDGDGEDASERLNVLLARWREPALTRVLPRWTIPDGTNRAATGVSIEHAHGIAMRICEVGFDRNHEIPVVVREKATDMVESEAFARWCATTVRNASVLPPCTRALWAFTEWAFTTLGSSHLNLALKLIEYDTETVFKGSKVRYGDALIRDAELRDAVMHGLPSVVLRPETPNRERSLISALLNRANDAGFRLNDQGVAVREGSQEAKHLTVFEALSRTLDSEELSSLARIKYGIDLDDATSGYIRSASTSAPHSRL